MRLDTQELEQWAQSHETDIRIAGAIYELAEGDIESMQSIWEDPTEYEVDFVNTWVPKSDQDSAFWGWDNLADIVNQSGI